MNFCSNPSDLRITDMRFVDIDGAPKRCTILRIDTNQGISGYGEVRDASSKTYALMLKSRILGENPCNVDKIFRKIKQFGGPSRQGGGVSGIEIALWDLAGKAYGVPLYQLLGGKFRDEIRVYCDTDVDGKHTGHDMGLALKKRMDMGFTFLKMDLGIGLLLDEPGTLNAPLGFIDDMMIEDRIRKIVADREWLTNWLADAFYDSLFFEVTAAHIPLSKVSAKISPCREDLWAEALLNGGYIIVYDLEEDEEHRINLKAIAKGFGKFIFDCPEQYAHMMLENYDSYDADCLLQIVVFGEVTYA